MQKSNTKSQIHSDIEGRAGMDTYNTTLDVRTRSGSPLSANRQYANGRNDFAEKNFIFARYHTTGKKRIGNSNGGIPFTFVGLEITIRKYRLFVQLRIAESATFVTTPCS